MLIQQPPFSVGKLIYTAAKRTPRDIGLFNPFAISVDNYYPNYKVLNGFEAKFGAVEARPTFVFNATFPLILQCVAQSDIPSKLLGLIHISSQVEVLGPQNWRLPSTVVVEIESVDESDKGLLYKIKTTVWQNKQVTLVNINEMLDKSRYYQGRSSIKVASNNDADFETLTNFEISQKDVWKYARISRDFNPIHMGNTFAKLFGLKGALVHGMLNAHLSLNKIIEQQNAPIKTIKIEFNKPCYIPANLTLSKKVDTQEFNLSSNCGTERHLKITVS